MKAVSHDSANACVMVETGAPSALRNTLPFTVVVAGQLAAEDGLRPCSISAVEVTMLNAEPGGKRPSMAWSTEPALTEPALTEPALTEAAASTDPVLAFTATSEAL